MYSCYDGYCDNPTEQLDKSAKTGRKKTIVTVESVMQSKFLFDLDCPKQVSHLMLSAFCAILFCLGWTTAFRKRSTY